MPVGQTAHQNSGLATSEGTLLLNMAPPARGGRCSLMIILNPSYLATWESSLGAKASELGPKAIGCRTKRIIGKMGVPLGGARISVPEEAPDNL